MAPRHRHGLPQQVTSRLRSIIIIFNILARTKNLEAVCRTADILVVAVGRAEMVKKDWVKPGAVVIDCGINSVEDSTKKSGYRLVGDVAYGEVAQVIMKMKNI